MFFFNFSILEIPTTSFMNVSNRQQKHFNGIFGSRSSVKAALQNNKPHRFKCNPLHIFSFSKFPFVQKGVQSKQNQEDLIF